MNEVPAHAGTNGMPEDARALLDAIFALSPDPMLLVRTADDQLVRASALWNHIVGWPEGAPPRMTLRSAKIWYDPQDADRLSATLHARGEIEDFRTSLLQRRPDGGFARRHVVLRARRITLGGILHHLVAARDVTAEWDMERQRHQARRLEEVGRLVGGVAHDFNNLLTVISAYTGLSVDAHHAREPILVEDLDEISRAAERAALMTRRLLAFSRDSAVIATPIDLNAAIRESTRLLERLLGEDVTLVLELAPSIAPILADAIQLDQILMNLAVNARDAMPSGGRLTVRTRRLRVRAGDVLSRRARLPEGDYITLEVQDTGEGMSDDVLAHVFEPFFTTKPPDKGTGLGLAMVRTIVQQGGGHIRVESIESAGTTFSIYWPPASVGEDDLLEDEPTERGRTGGARVLLVEDDEPVRIAICRLLRASGYHVVEARDGNHALARLESATEPIHVVLTDVVLPGMTGRELAARLLATHPRLPVLLMTGYSDRAEDLRGRPNITGPILRKPMEREELVDAVERALERSRSSTHP